MVEEVTAVYVLTETRKLLSVPERWTKKQFARDALGGTADPTGPLAVCFCVEGAIHRAAVGDAHIEARLAAKQILRQAIGLGVLDGLPGWNDAPERTHAEVLAAFARAIELAKAAEST